MSHFSKGILNKVTYRAADLVTRQMDRVQLGTQPDFRGNRTIDIRQNELKLFQVRKCPNVRGDGACKGVRFQRQCF